MLAWHSTVNHQEEASSGTAISTDFATLTCSEILSKILIRCVTWHGACDCSFRCFYEIGRYFDNNEQERAKTRARRHDRSQRRQEHPKIDSFEVLTPVLSIFSIILPYVAETGKMSLFA